MYEPNLLLGSVCTVTAAFLFGTMFVPIKRFQQFDGMFVQLMMGVGMLVVGMVSAALAGFPPIYPLALLGGGMYAIVNVLCLFAMKGLGLAVGCLIWNTVTSLVGWGVARFGLLGYEVSEPVSNWLNITGVVLTCVGGVFFAFVRHVPISVRPAPFQQKDTSEEKLNLEEGKDGEEEHHVPLKKRLVAIGCCVIIGLLLGNLITPINTLIRYHDYYNTPTDINQYIFSHIYGSFLASLLIFVLHSMYKRNVPLINPEVACPAIFSGILIAMATCMMFLANQHIGQIIAYPIINSTPGIVASIWSIFLFQEIRGRANYIKLVTAYCITLVGVLCIVLSKIQF